MLQLGAGLGIAGALALLPVTAIEAESPRPPLPDSVRQALDLLANLGFDDIVAVYHDLRPSIEIQPASVLSFGGLTEGWTTSRRITASVRLRADLQRYPPVLAAILSHELLHVRQLVYEPEVYASCLEREVPAYRLEAAVLSAWCAANPTQRDALPAFGINLMSLAESNYSQSLVTFAGKASCGIG
jgi:hypothetical protein